MAKVALQHTYAMEVMGQKIGMKKIAHVRLQHQHQLQHRRRRLQFALT